MFCFVLFLCQWFWCVYSVYKQEFEETICCYKEPISASYMQNNKPSVCPAVGVLQMQKLRSPPGGHTDGFLFCMRRTDWLFITALPRVALRWTPDDKQKRGRPKETWRRTVEREMGEQGWTWGYLERLSADRPQWRTLVAALCTTPCEEDWLTSNWWEAQGKGSLFLSLELVRI